MKSYYVYEHWLDNQCFYVGKGSYIHNRAYNFYDSCRNDNWVNYVKGRKDKITVKIIKEFETEQDAYDYEKEHSLKMKRAGWPIVGEADGKAIYGEKNHNYGKKRPEHGEKMKGKNNPRFGKSPYEYKTEKEKQEIIKRQKESRSGKTTGENNGMYGRIGGLNPSARRVLLIDINGNIIKTFETAKDCVMGDWRFDFPKKNGINYVGKCLKEGLPFHEHYLKYEDDYLEELKNE